MSWSAVISRIHHKRLHLYHVYKTVFLCHYGKLGPGKTKTKTKGKKKDHFAGGRMLGTERRVDCRRGNQLTPPYGVSAGLMFGTQTNTHFHHQAGGGVSLKKKKGKKKKKKNQRRFSAMGLEECCVSTRINPVGESSLPPTLLTPSMHEGVPNHFQVLFSFFHSCRIWKAGAREMLRCFLCEFI